ncbi:MAG: hypothetical protein P4L86_02120, partial [Mycobacterium sp.]|nr:hypothetical protein [Mycobacterium sp.]
MNEGEVVIDLDLIIRPDARIDLAASGGFFRFCVPPNDAQRVGAIQLFDSFIRQPDIIFRNRLASG